MNIFLRLVAVLMLSISALCGMPTVEVPVQDSTAAAIPGMASMPDASVMPVIPATGVPAAQVQGGMPAVTLESNTDKKDKSKKDNQKDGAKKDSPSLLQMKELKFVDDGLKGVGKVIDLFVGPFEDFGEAIPPTVSSLFGPFAHIHWSLIIRSMQKRIKKAREEFAALIGKPMPVEVKVAKPQAPVDFMAAMQQEIQKKEPDQKKKSGIAKFMPKPILKKIYDAALNFVKKATKPLEKKSLAVAELFEPLPPIPFLVTVSDVQLALHILSLQQRLAIIEESLKNKLEPLEDIKKRALKDAVKVADLDPMVAMAAGPELTPEQKKKAEADALKKSKKKDEAPGVKLKDTKQVQSVYAAFKKIDSMMNVITKPIEKLTKDLPAMPIPLISFMGAFIGLTSVPMVFSGLLTSVGLAVAAGATAVYGIAQSQFKIYIRNLQELLGKIEGDMKNYQAAKKQGQIYASDPSKVLPQGQENMVPADQSAVSQDGTGMPNLGATEQASALPEMSGAGVAVSSETSTDGAVPSE